MPVLVTGATGLLGSHLVDMLVDRGTSVRILVRPGESIEPIPPGKIEICRGDLGDGASIRAAVRGVDRVLHCAARTGPWGPRAEYEVANVSGLIGLVNAALSAGVRRFVHVSSITVHGNDVGGSADETSPFYAEANPYSWSKIEGERLLEKVIRDQNAPITIVRPGWIYGPRDRASFARFADQVRRGRMIVVGSGNNHIPLIHVRDVARGILLASEVAAAAGRTYLLVNDEPVTQNDYLSAIAAGLGVPRPSRHVPYRLLLAAGAMAESVARLAHRSSPPPLTRYGVQLLGGENRFAITRANCELGFFPRIDVMTGVGQSLEWYCSEFCVRGAWEQ